MKDKVGARQEPGNPVPSFMPVPVRKRTSRDELTGLLTYLSNKSTWDKSTQLPLTPSPQDHSSNDSATAPGIEQKAPGKSCLRLQIRFGHTNPAAAPLQFNKKREDGGNGAREHQTRGKLCSTMESSCNRSKAHGPEDGESTSPKAAGESQEPCVEDIEHPEMIYVQELGPPQPPRSINIPQLDLDKIVSDPNILKYAPSLHPAKTSQSPPEKKDELYDSPRTQCSCRNQVARLPQCGCMLF
jgi:hypothetical protein